MPTIDSHVLSTGELHGYILEMLESRENGVVHCRPYPQPEDRWSKMISLWDGRIICAQSTLPDDRLGEIIYRDGGIKLADFVEIAGQVSEYQKFGQFLVGKQLLTPLQLWESLRIQSEWVVYSTGLWSRWEVGFQRTDEPPQTDLSFEADVVNLLSDARRYGRHVSECHLQLMQQQDLHLALPNELEFALEYQREVADAMLHRSYSDFLASSQRVCPEYQRAMVFDLYTRGWLKNSLTLSAPRPLYDELSHYDWFRHLFLELHQAAMKENIKDWPEICAVAQRHLQGIFGAGNWLSYTRGFLFENLHRSQWHRRISLPTNRGLSQMEPAEKRLLGLRESLLDCLLYILFELYNRRPDSAHVKTVQLELDRGVPQNPLSGQAS